MLTEARSQHYAVVTKAWWLVGVLGVLEAAFLMPGARIAGGIWALLMFAACSLLAFLVLGFHMVANPLCQRRCMRIISTLFLVIAVFIGLVCLVMAPTLEGQDRGFTAAAVSGAAGIGWMSHVVWKWNQPDAASGA